MRVVPSGALPDVEVVVVNRVEHCLVVLVIVESHLYHPIISIKAMCLYKVFTQHPPKSYQDEDNGY